MKKIILNILIACEESQAECIAFRELGHRAFSCDIQSCRRGGHPEWHIKADVTPFLSGKTTFRTMDKRQHRLKKWDLIIAHPPCTYLCKIGAQWIYKNCSGEGWFNGKLRKLNLERIEKMNQGREFFLKCLNAKADYLAVENPIPMRAANLPRPNAYVCPSWFGVKYTKKTCYWLRNLPPIFAQIEHSHTKCFVTTSRGKYRSRTFPQLASAIAKQWSDYIIEDIQK